MSPRSVLLKEIIAYDEIGVQINEIIAIGGKGEYDKPFEPDRIDSYGRIFLHLTYLIKYTKAYHEQLAHNTASTEIITRLALNEFSLYTAGKPLNLDEYKQIAKWVAASAKELPPNIHLFIATLPVLWPNNILHNVAFYVQSPTSYSRGEPLLHHFTKRYPAEGDLIYRDEKNKPFPLFNSDMPKTFLSTSCKHNPYFDLIDSPFLINDKNQFYGALRIFTARGQVVGLSFQICFEYLHGTDLNDMVVLIMRLKKLGEELPSLFSLLVASNWIPLTRQSISPLITHADPEAVKILLEKGHCVTGRIHHKHFTPVRTYAFSHRLQPTSHPDLQAILPEPKETAMTQTPSFTFFSLQPQTTLAASTCDTSTSQEESMDTYSYAAPTTLHHQGFFSAFSPSTNSLANNIVNYAP